MGSGAALWPRGPCVLLLQGLRGHSVLLLLLLSTSAASASASGAVHYMTAHHRSNVSLPCEGPAVSDPANLYLVWTHSDRHQSYVFMFRDGRPLYSSQHQQFRHRVELSDPDLKAGNYSINLKNVGKSDNGRYKCHFLRQSQRRKRSVLGTEPIRTVELKVVVSDHAQRQQTFPLSATLRAEAGAGFVVFVALFLQILK